VSQRAQDRPPVRVVDNSEDAADLIQQGMNVVLVVDRDAGEPNAGEVVRLAGGSGRLAVMVGRSGDPAVMAAALEMAAELF
jgi:hypothetical protein